MHELTVGFDWRKSGLSPLEDWPSSLKDLARIALLSTAPMALLVGRRGIFFYNDAAASVLGEHYSTSLGRPVFDVLPAAAQFLETAIADAYRGKPTSLKDQPLRLWRAGHEQVAWFDLDFSAVTDEHGDVHATLVVAAETTGRVNAMRELRLQRERLDLALDAGGLVGIWEVDFETDLVRSDERFAILHGVPVSTARIGSTRDVFQAGVHPDDLKLVNDAFDVAKSSGTYRCLHRVTGSGETRWIVASGRIQTDDGGRPHSFAGIAVDVTQQVEATDSLAASERRFRSFTESMPQIVFGTDAEGRPNYVNPRWYEYTGIEGSELVESRWQNVLHTDDLKMALDVWQEAIADQHADRVDVELRLKHRSGVFRWCRAIALPVKAVDGSVSGWVGTLTDIHEAKMLQVERELVSRELDHRMKNFFAVANGLVALTARDTLDVKAFQQRLTDRLRALHAAHGFITRSGPVYEIGRRYSLLGLLQQLLEPFAAFDRIAIIGDDVEIAGGMVTSIALVFHELATNAAKYGALVQPDGKLDLTLEQDSERLVVTWNERFDMPATAGEPGGFGSRMLYLVIEAQLGGQFERDLGAHGLAVRIELPLSRLQG